MQKKVPQPVSQKRKIEKLKNYCQQLNLNLKYACSIIFQNNY